MRTARNAMLITSLALVAMGCEKLSTSPGSGDVALGTADLSAQVSQNGGGGCGDLPTAPESLRVDLYSPSFGNPTRVTNPLFPIRDLSRVLLLGTSDGEPLRVETTLLPHTKTIRVNGRRVETLASQYVAWLDGRIHEVAIDWYAQDDKGAVWYFGEDVFNYEDGKIADTDGTWLAGKDGPAAMIMPANPQVGDVWRPENVCGVVFEEVDATATGLTVPGPRGPVSGALVVRELHMDGTYEDKTFAPGYGEFSTGSGDNLEAVALAVPTDALSGRTPEELRTISKGAAKIFRAAKSEHWNAASDAVEDMDEAWASFRGAGVPPMLEAQMNSTLEALGEAVDGRDTAEARQASIDVARASLDFQLRYRPRAEIDIAQIELWARQLIVDVAARDRGAVRGDLATIKWIQARMARPLDRDCDAHLFALQSAALVGDETATTDGAEKLQATLARSTPSVPQL